MGNARMEALEDAYNTLNKIKKSKEVKTVKKSYKTQQKKRGPQTLKTKVNSFMYRYGFFIY